MQVSNRVIDSYEKILPLHLWIQPSTFFLTKVKNVILVGGLVFIERERKRQRVRKADRQKEKERE